MKNFIKIIISHIFINVFYLIVGFGSISILQEEIESENLYTFVLIIYFLTIPLAYMLCGGIIYRKGTIKKKDTLCIFSLSFILLLICLTLALFDASSIDFMVFLNFPIAFFVDNFSGNIRHLLFFISNIVPSLLIFLGAIAWQKREKLFILIWLIKRKVKGKFKNKSQVTK